MSTGSPEGTKEKKKPTKGTLAIGIGLIAALIALVLVILFVLKLTNVVEKPVLKIGDKAISKEDYARYVEQGKQAGVSEEDVRTTVIEYNKNKIIAEKNNIEIPEVMLEQIPQGMFRNTLKMSAEDLQAMESQPADAYQDFTDFNKAQRYNFAFDRYVNLASTGGGWGIVTYDLPLTSSEATEAEIAQLKNDAQTLRTQISDKELTPSQAITETTENMVGQSSQTGFVLVRENDGSLITSSGGLSYGILSPDNILPLLKDKQLGLTDVMVLDGRSVYFLDVLFKVNAKEDMLQQVAGEKEQIKVVDYARN